MSEPVAIGEIPSRTTDGAYLTHEQLAELAGPPTKVAQLLDLIGLAQVPFDLARDLREKFRTLFPSGELEPKHQAAVGLVTTEMLSKPYDLLNSFEELYATSFSEEEIDQLIAFHSSPIGRRIHAFGATLQEQIMKLSDAWGQTALKDIDAELAAILAGDSTTPQP